MDWWIWMDGWMDEWMNECVYVYIYIWVYVYVSMHNYWIMTEYTGIWRDIHTWICNQLGQITIWNLKSWAIVGWYPTIIAVRENSEVVIIYPEDVQADMNWHVDFDMVYMHIICINSGILLEHGQAGEISTTTMQERVVLFQKKGGIWITEMCSFVFMIFSKMTEGLANIWIDKLLPAGFAAVSANHCRGALSTLRRHRTFFKMICSYDL